MLSYFVQTCLALVLFTAEWYHVLGHAMILFRVRMLPHKDLVRLRFYFFIDTLTVLMTSILFTERLRWAAALHFIHHTSYVIFWEKMWLAKRITAWSSLDWFKSKRGEHWEIDSITITSLDLFVHFCMAFSLCQYLDSVLVMCSQALVQLVMFVVMFGSNYSWASPGKEPVLILKRLHPEKFR